MPTVAEIGAFAFDGVAAGIPDAVHTATISAATGRVVFDTKQPASEFTAFTPEGSVEIALLEGFTTAPADGDTLTVNSVDWYIIRVTDIVAAGSLFYAAVIKESELLSQSITIDQITLTPDSQGGYTEADVSTAVSAGIFGLGGDERWQADRSTPGTKYRCIVPFAADANSNPKWTIADKVTWRAREYGILSVQDIGGRSNWIELMLTDGTR